jgi:hypothetical protein
MQAPKSAHRVTQTEGARRLDAITDYGRITVTYTGTINTRFHWTGHLF